MAVKESQSFFSLVSGGGGSGSGDRLPPHPLLFPALPFLPSRRSFLPSSLLYSNSLTHPLPSSILLLPSIITTTQLCIVVSRRVGDSLFFITSTTSTLPPTLTSTTSQSSSSSVDSSRRSLSRDRSVIVSLVPVLHSCLPCLQPGWLSTRTPLSSPPLLELEESDCQRATQSHRHDAITLVVTGIPISSSLCSLLVSITSVFSQPLACQEFVTDRKCLTQSVAGSRSAHF